MAIQYIVKQGDCLSSIAAHFGCLSGTLWSMPENAALREKRKNPNILFPGDILAIPNHQPGVEPGTTESRHKFVKTGEEVNVRIKLMIEFEPRVGVPCFFTVNGTSSAKTTDSKGEVDFQVPPTAMTGVLNVGSPHSSEVYTVFLGSLDPIDTVEGIQERLNNLGFDSGKVDGILGPITEGAIKRFQASQRLVVDGIVGPITRAKLLKVHGS